MATDQLNTQTGSRQRVESNARLCLAKSATVLVTYMPGAMSVPVFATLFRSCILAIQNLGSSQNRDLVAFLMMNKLSGLRSRCKCPDAVGSSQTCTIWAAIPAPSRPQYAVLQQLLPGSPRKNSMIPRPSSVLPASLHLDDVLVICAARCELRFTKRRQSSRSDVL